MKTIVRLVIALMLIVNSNGAEPVKAPNKQKFRIYILMGQSNMAGRGAVEKEDKTPHPRVLMLQTNDTWVPAIEPLTRDPNKVHGVGPGLAFGKAMAEKFPNVTIGLVATAVGGTPLSRWQKGGDLYEKAVLFWNGAKIRERGVSLLHFGKAEAVKIRVVVLHACV